MTDDDAPKDEGHLTQPEPKPTPALLISPESLMFSAGDVSTNLTLDQVMQAAIASKNPVGLLLYGVILKVNDVDMSLRAIVNLGNAQRERVEGMTAEPGKLIGEVVTALQKLGFPDPSAQPPEPVEHPARGNGS
jgi:hypothetical protein